MANNTFISFSFTNENEKLKDRVVSHMTEKGLAYDYSEKVDRSHCSDETIWKYLQNRIKGSSVTVLLLTDDLISTNRHKLLPGNDFMSSGWVYKEISCSLRDWDNNRINGLLIVDCTSNKSYKNSLYKHEREIINANINNMKGVREVGASIDNCKYNPTTSFITVCTYEQFMQKTDSWLDDARRKRDDHIKNNTYWIKYDFHNR